MKNLIRRLRAADGAAGQGAPLVVMDAGYSAAALTAALAGQPAHLLIRLASGSDAAWILAQPPAQIGAGLHDRFVAMRDAGLMASPAQPARMIADSSPATPPARSPGPATQPRSRENQPDWPSPRPPGLREPLCRHRGHLTLVYRGYRLTDRKARAVSPAR